MQHGLLGLHKDKEPDNKEPKDELTDSERITGLESQIKNMETKSKQDQQNQAILSATNRSLDKFDLTKNGNLITKKIRILGLARLQHNPRAKIEELIAEEVKDFMEIFDEQGKELENIRKANAKVAAAVTGVVTGPGGIPVVDKEKKFTPEDLRGTASREALRMVLEAKE